MKTTISALSLCILLTGIAGRSFGNQNLAATNNMNLCAYQSDPTDYEKYKKEQQTKIKDNEKKIDDLKAKMSKEKQEVKDKYNERISNIEQKNKDLKKKISEHKKDENNAKWDAFKRDFENGMDDVTKSIKDLTTDYKK